MNNPDELNYIERIRNGETNLFSYLVTRYSNSIYSLIVRIVLTKEDAEELTQDSFLKAFKKLDSFKGDCSFSTWLFRIAVNESLTFLSNQREKFNVSIDELQDNLSQGLEADSYFSGDEVQLQFQRAILTLPEKQRLVFNMKYFDNLKYEEMEEILGTSVGALKASYHHAVKKIEQFLLHEV